MKGVKKIKVTVETFTDDGSRSELVIALNPNTFQMTQSRNAKPVYGPLKSKTWGRPGGFEVGKTHLALSGDVVGEGERA